MYDFIKLDKEERSQAFIIASKQLGYPAYVIEKDFGLLIRYSSKT